MTSWEEMRQQGEAQNIVAPSQISTPIALVKRLTCARCERAQSGCICKWITPTASATEVLILQHPMEVRHAKGSARLLSFSLINCRIEVAETFEPAKLLQLLTAPWLAAASARRQPILLYPPPPKNAAGFHPIQTTLRPEQYAYPAQLRLVVIDASWRKSRKMLYANPLLQNLKRLQLDQIPESKYRIRKAQHADQLSTFEATCAALMQLEGLNPAFEVLLAGFEGFVQQLAEQLTQPHILPTASIEPAF